MKLNHEYSAVLVEGRRDRHGVQSERYAIFRTADPANVLYHIHLVKGPTHAEWWSIDRVFIYGRTVLLSSLLEKARNEREAQ